MKKPAGDKLSAKRPREPEAGTKPLIRDTLTDLGLAPSKSRGQNFLKDQQQISRIVGVILKDASRAAVMEIGPGLGALTRPLLEAGTLVTAVELDRGLADNLVENLAPLYPGRLNILHRDVLSLSTDELSADAPFHLCGNLPYNISSPVLFWFLTNRRFFTGATFMLQKEMAIRLTARAGTKDYGRLTVALSLWFRIKTVLDVPPSAFHPRPKVDSTVISLTPLPDGGQSPVSPEVLGRFTAAAFAARRKTIFNNLAKVYGRLKTESALSALNLPPSLRAESLEPKTLAALALRLESM